MQIEIYEKVNLLSTKKPHGYFLLSSISWMCCMTLEGGR